MKKKYHWIIGISLVIFTPIAITIISFNNCMYGTHTTECNPKFTPPIFCECKGYAKTEACNELVHLGCEKTSSISILIDYDANRDGTIDSRDTLFEVCKNYYAIEDDNRCKEIVCSCIIETENAQCPTCSEPTSWSNCSSNRQMRYRYVCNETTNFTCKPYTEFQLCQIPKDEKTLLYSKTCNELFNLSSEEFKKIDFSCINDSDCNRTDVFMCDGCINKNYDATRYGWIKSVLNYKGCITNVASCKIIFSCKCVNNKCESL